ncbi:MAG: hypothetical protein ABIP49_03205 [Lysobacterales bacterium]
MALTSLAPTHAADLGAWGGYAMAQMLPEYDWVEKRHAADAAPTVFEIGNGGAAFASASLIESILPDLSFSLGAERRMQGAQGVELAPSLLPQLRPGIERSLLAPGITQTFGDDAALTVTALFARQQYASWGFGTGIGSNEYQLTGTESSTGQGAAIGWRDGLTPALSYRLTYQSRINMDPLQSVRGVYADTADFDMPAIASVGFDWQLAPHWQIGVDASRIAYGDIRAFTSATLPREFLALLGDGDSPDFGWRDLTVYGAQVGWQPGEQTRMTLRYSTQQQPRPTSSVLDAALRDRYSDVNWSLGFERRTPAWGWWQLVASYSPAQLFLGAPSFADKDLEGRLLEVEALWTYAF